MKLFADHYFHIGRAHYTGGKPCQDFALSRSTGAVACAIVSDGCSTGGETCVGARLVALTARNAIRAFGLDSAAVADFLKLLLISQRLSLSLDVSDMQATCIYAFVNENGAAVQVQGDGVLVLQYRSGGMHLWRYDWSGNAPFYPSYTDDDVGQYVQRIHKGDKDAAFLSITSGWIRVGVWAPDPDLDIPLEEARRGIRLQISIEELAAIEFIAVFSDGVTQIDNLDWRDAVVNFMAFKTTEGEFAKRRMIRGIKDAEKIGKGPIDDISFAVIRIENEEAGA